jgi:RimJ/RimL family protein N-acetyltransferase
MIQLKELEYSDLDILLAWRSNPDIYKNYKNNRVIPWEEHKNWFYNRKNRIDWIILLDDRRVGTLNIITLDTYPEIGILIGDTTLWNRGIGTETVKLGINWLIQQKYDKVCATVKKENISSCKLWEKLNFVREDLNKKFYIYKRYL